MDKIHSDIPTSTQRKNSQRNMIIEKKCDWMISNMRFLFDDFAIFNNIILTKYISFNLYNNLNYFCMK